MSHEPLQAALGTKHGKEAIFQAPFADLGVSIIVAEVDTDLFGTFAGEVERQGSPRDTVERKARAAIEATGLPIGLASEGSFGPHPATPFLLANTEIVAYVDDERDYSVFESASAVSAIPSTVILDGGDAADELEHLEGLKISSMFPDQRAIVVVEDPTTRSRTVLAKGIDSLDELRVVVAQARVDQAHPIIIEPDLRAHYCPERRNVIRAAVDRLVTRLRVMCPDCGVAGFGPLRTVPGLRCGICGLPTTRPAADLMGCTRCGLETEIARSGEADPTYCDRCNP